MDLLRFTVFWDWMSCPLVGETNIPEKPAAPTLKKVQAGSCDKLTPSVRWQSHIQKKVIYVFGAVKITKLVRLWFWCRCVSNIWLNSLGIAFWNLTKARSLLELLLS